MSYSYKPCRNLFSELQISRIKDFIDNTTILQNVFHSTISGPSTVCSSGATFTLNNPPQVDSIIWETGPYLTVYSGQNTDSPIIKATGNGRSWVQVRLVNDCGSITLPRQTVWAGTEMATTFSPFDLNQQVYTWYPLCVGTPYEFRASLQDPSENPSDYFWTVWDEKEELMYMCPSGTGGYFVANHPGFYTVNLIYNNGCGWGSERSVRFEFEKCGGLFLLISPNPTTGETTLTIESGTETETLKSASVGEDTFDYNAEWDMEIYSPMQALQTKKTRFKGKSTTIQTTGWTEGVYTVRVKYKDQVLTGKLIVKR